MAKQTRIRAILMGTLLLLTVFCGIATWVALIQSRQATRDSALVNYVLWGNADDVQRLLKMGADPNTRFIPRPQPSGLLEYISSTLQSGQETRAATVLMRAAATNNEVVQMLLDAGAEVNATENGNNTPLMFAAMKDNVGMAALLLERGAKINAQNSEGMTALMFAAANGFDDMAELLLRRNADIRARDHNGWTALFFAAQFGNTSIIKRLLEYGADLNARSQDGHTAVQAAANQGHPEVARWLRKAGAKD